MTDPELRCTYRWTKCPNKVVTVWICGENEEEETVTLCQTHADEIYRLVAREHGEEAARAGMGGFQPKGA
jgi:hypothetical protein